MVFYKKHSYSENSGEDTPKKSIKDIFTDKPHIEIIDNKTVNIEGSKGVMEYSNKVIRVNLGEYSVVFSGRSLALRCISPTVLVIEGFILNIEFCM